MMLGGFGGLVSEDGAQLVLQSIPVCSAQLTETTPGASYKKMGEVVVLEGVTYQYLLFLFALGMELEGESMNVVHFTRAFTQCNSCIDKMRRCSETTVSHPKGFSAMHVSLFDHDSI